jgi:hypothetical protein
MRFDLRFGRECPGASHANACRHRIAGEITCHNLYSQNSVSGIWILSNLINAAAANETHTLLSLHFNRDLLTLKYNAIPPLFEIYTPSFAQKRFMQ